MSLVPHDHEVFVEGCFRCELSRDEAALLEEEDRRLKESGYGRCQGCEGQEPLEVLEALEGFCSSECRRDHL